MRYNILTYHIGEGIRNLFKNKKSTIASLCIMMATMLMFGIFFIIGQNINHIMKTIEEDQGIQVFIVEGADSKEVQEVRDIISQIDGVASATIYTKQDALDQMKTKLKDNEELLEGYEGDNNIFPDSVIVKLTDLEKSASVQEKINQITVNGENYIDSIQSSDKTINALINIANGIKIVTGVLLILLIAISIFIISNTIKLTVHARRKEISIMKYVGATNSFIRWPFIVEGIIIGIISALLTLLLIYGGYTLVISKIVGVFNSIQVNISLLTFKDLYQLILIVYMILGIGIGALGSSISMKKYLDV
ncbi:MAG: permease-like cell division protein FtsX [Clostridia bacterium]|nr:permease-like cell division protein FtsX [Clostridia bacterium]